MTADVFTGSKYKAAPASAGAAIDLSATDVSLTQVSRAVYVGGAGDVKVDMPSATAVTFKNMQLGWHPIRVSKIYKTGTTATDLVVVW